MSLLVSTAQTDDIPLIMAWWRWWMVAVVVMEVCKVGMAGVWRVNGRGLSLVVEEVM